jgi:3D-(3,5/4)-trihydroxycyclohexane-1,2-dione acylhydrolase (decyclizing)
VSLTVEQQAPSVDSEGTVRLTTSQAIVRFLQSQWSERDGVRRRLIPAVFGIFGHGNVCGFGQALEEYGSELPLYQPKNEQAMVHIAIGFARASNRLATLACSASIGPGSTNLVSGAATATVNRIPVLLLPSDTFANRRQGPVLQALEHPSEADLTVNDCLRPVSRFFDRISRPEQILTALPQAMRVLLDPADTGAVTLSLHQDVQGEVFDFPLDFFAERAWVVSRRPPAPEDLSRAVDVLRTARRPLLIAGGGVHYSDAGGELRSFAEAFGIPVAETYAGKGAYTGSLLAGGIGLGGTTAANSLATEADVVICVGTRLDDLITGSNSLFRDLGVRFIGINVAAYDAYKLGAVAVVADARLALASLRESLEDSGWKSPATYRDTIGDHQSTWSNELDADLAERESERMSQAQVMRCLNGLSRSEDVIVGAAGTVPVDLLRLWDCATGAACNIEFGFSCMGHEIPAALGIRMAKPHAGEIYVFIGDGNYLMANTELATAVQENLKITVVIIENGGYQSIHGLQRAKTGTSFGTEFRYRVQESGTLSGPYLDVDYAANAESFGCAVFDTRSLSEFADAVAKARDESRPCAIVAHVEPLRLMAGAECWWDVGVAQTSERPALREIAANHVREAATLQRYYV